LAGLNSRYCPDIQSIFLKPLIYSSILISHIADYDALFFPYWKSVLDLGKTTNYPFPDDFFLCDSGFNAFDNHPRQVEAIPLVNIPPLQLTSSTTYEL